MRESPGETLYFVFPWYEMGGERTVDYIEFNKCLGYKCSDIERSI